MAESPTGSHGASRFERLLLSGLGIAVLVTTVVGLVSARPAPSREDLLAAAASGYQDLWRDIDSVAAAAAQGLATRDLSAGPEIASFEGLAAAMPAQERRHWGLYLLDPAGDLRAWAGEGFLHALEVEALPEAGRAFFASVTSVTLLTVQEVSQHAGWRVVAGMSLASNRLPFALAGRAHLRTHWGVATAGGPAPAGRAQVTLAETPTLLIDEAELGFSGPREWSWARHPLTWIGGWLLLAVAVSGQRLRWLAAPLAAIALIAWGIVAGASVGWLASLALATLALFGSGALALRRRVVRRPVWRGALVTALLMALAWWIQRLTLVDLAHHFVAAGPAWVVRAVLFFFALAGLGCLIRSGEAPESRSRPVWLGALAVALAAALIDWPLASTLFMLIGGASLGVGLGARSMRRRPLTLGALVVLAALAAATASEMAYRAELRRHLAGPVLTALAPPARSETALLRDDLATHFERLDISDLTAGDIYGVDASDLAFEIWRRSPLARNRAVSALAVRGPSGRETLFSFGIPIGRSGRPQVESRERPFDSPVWDFALINEVAGVDLAGEPWGAVEYWLLVRPGFRLAAERLEDVAGDLLRGGPSGRGAVQQQIAPASFAHYSTPRQARISPWIEAPELPAEVLAAGRGRMVTPDGPSWVWTSPEPEGTRAIFLPRLGPVDAFERVGIHAIGNLWPLVGLLLAILLLRLSRASSRQQLANLWHSYSRRLVLVFSMLVLVPAVIVDVLVLRVMRDRAEQEQLAEARGALVAAQRVLGEYAASQSPGVSLTTILDDDLLSWLASVLDHDINLYWTGNSELAASSRQELFAAGLLPQRVPGEIYASLYLRGHRLASRLQRSGDTEYTELYALLTAPDEELEDAGFFLSVPLLAQEEQIAASIEELRHKVVLASTLLVLLLVALGARLATSFTTPLEDLVEGTQRIAAGAERLGLEPRELELATLVEAIDRMAERIADGRRRLLLEKQVVERMVENITAAVVSIDAEYRVLMQNEVAGRLLGTEVGVSIEASLASSANLERVLAGLRRSQELGAPQSASIKSGEDEEPRQLSLIWVPIPGPGEPTALLVVEDVTEVVRGQRLQAWAEMARMIAHEIKNPLTPIRLSAEHLREVRERDPANFDRIFDQCISNILRHVDELRAISSEFSTYSRIPRIEPTPGDLVAMVRELVAGYQLALPKSISLSLAAEVEDPVTSFDAKMLGRAVRNLIENSIRAVAEGGRVDVVVAIETDTAVIEVKDSGPGVAPEQLGRIFDPYFSTHDSGTGLGLPITRRIVEEHGGEIHARNRRGGGLAVRLILPRRGIRRGADAPGGRPIG